jgi:hypothetical protein
MSDISPSDPMTASENVPDGERERPAAAGARHGRRDLSTVRKPDVRRGLVRNVDYFSYRGVADLMGVSVNTAKTWCRSRGLASYHPPGCRDAIILKRDLVAWLGFDPTDASLTTQ